MREGRFLSPLRVELVDPLDNRGSGRWKLIGPISYQTSFGRTFTVPAGFETDFASVPRLPFAYWLTGNTAHGPAVVHDYLCRTGLVPRELADEVFKEAMHTIGMPRWRVVAMYQAVATYTRSLFSKITGE